MLLFAPVAPQLLWCGAHAYGTAIVQRSGAVHWFPPTAHHVWPAVLEGEILLVPQQQQQSLTVVLYDCALSPTMSYVHHGRHLTRLPPGVCETTTTPGPSAALQAILHRWEPPPGLTLLRKPCYPLALHPQGAIQRCLAWSNDTGIPCDGVILADSRVVGYGATERLCSRRRRGTLCMPDALHPPSAHPGS